MISAFFSSENTARFGLLHPVRLKTKIKNKMAVNFFFIILILAPHIIIIKNPGPLRHCSNRPGLIFTIYTPDLELF